MPALFLFGAQWARGDVTLLLGEPIHLLGWVTSTGHAALLLDDVCSDDHLHVRMCRPGEPGTVISRYQGISGYDWIAMEPMPYLFAVDSAAEVPSTISQRESNRMRDTYGSEHLLQFAADSRDGAWEQLLGASYRREIISIRLHTTPEQDLRLVKWLNSRKNRGHFNLFYSNCADFTRRMLNVLFPGSVHRDFLFDAGVTTPKQLATGLHRYSKRHPEVGFEVEVVEQVEGDIDRSGKMYGITESFVRTKPYLLPLAVLQPVGIGSVVASAICDRRYNVQLRSRSAPALRLSDPEWPERLETQEPVGEQPSGAN